MTDVTSNLLPLCESLPGHHILVIGDVILDKFIYGAVERISPESPVPVLSQSREETMLGGAGNALSNLAGLGVKASLLSVIGDDEQGEVVKTVLTSLGCDSQSLIIDQTRPTSVKTRFLAGHQQLLRSDFENATPVSDLITAQLITAAEALIKDVQAIIMSDYGKGVLSRALIEAVIKLAKAKKIPVLVDPKSKDFSLYAGVDIITPNRKELSEAAGNVPVKTDADILSVSTNLIEQCDIATIFATRSEDGMSVITKGVDPYHVRPTQNIEVFDVSGAGDTVIATIAAVLAAGGDLRQAAQLANIAGQIAVTKVGTAPIRLDELRTALSDARGSALLPWEEAAEQIKRWRARGLKVGFTNGCFDILHAGHVTYLAEARSQCDRLIVALNHDASVRILKGDDRPIHDENARATVLGALSAVDTVVLFGAEEQGGDNTACALLEALKPDLYFKGGDYALDQIPEAPTVQSYGGKVSVLSNVEGYSTSTAISKIRNDQAA